MKCTRSILLWLLVGCCIPTLQAQEQRQSKAGPAATAGAERLLYPAHLALAASVPPRHLELYLMVAICRCRGLIATSATRSPNIRLFPRKTTPPEDLPSILPSATTPPPPFYMAVKTNLLYDALLVPNLGVVFYLGRSWSLSGNWQYAWWSSNRHHRYWRTYGGDFALRKWVGRRSRSKPLTGHHVGIYGQLLTYDFEWGGRGYLADKWNYAAGVEYGYALPVGRRLNLDFVIGIGYGGGTCEEYRPRNGCYIRQAVRDRHWVGPTKAEISLVWLIGRGNTNQFNQK